MVKTLLDTTFKLRWQHKLHDCMSLNHGLSIVAHNAQMCPLSSIFMH